MYVYIRPDKHFEDVYEQIKTLHAYLLFENIHLYRELIDYSSKGKSLQERLEAITFFRSIHKATLLVYDIWVLSTNIENLMQIISCLLKNGNTIFLLKSSTRIDSNCDIMTLLSAVDGLRQKLHVDTTKEIGRPKGRYSASKFDKYIDKILSMLQEGENVSTMARILNVSRSSLKDYIHSRELYGVLEHVKKIQKNVEVSYSKDMIKCPEARQYNKGE